MRMVERGDQLALLDGLFRQCERGQGAVSIVLGSVGSGKSQLLNAFAKEAAAAGAIVLSANGSPSESELPLSVLGQLAHNATLPADGAPRNAEPQEETAIPSMLQGVEAGGHNWARSLERIRGSLLGAARHRSVVIGIDDVQYADSHSLQCLLYCAHRIRSARVLLVMTASEASLERSLPVAELVRLPHCHVTRLAPLTVSGIAAVLATSPDGDRGAEQRAAPWHAVSGGNPRLVRALLEDQPFSASSASQQLGPMPFVGHAFRQAVLSCLHRSEPDMRKVACGLAILGDNVSPKLIGELVSMDPLAVTCSLRQLENGGLLGADRFRHSQIRAAVLVSMTSEERARMHLCASRLLYDGGAAAATVANHLVAADQSPAPWALPVLREAARFALGDDRVETGIACLELAERLSDDVAERAMIKARLADAESRIDPARALRHLPTLVEAARAGIIDDAHAAVVIRLLLWHGRLDEAVDLLHHLRDRPDMPDTEGLLEGVAHWLAVQCPSLPALKTRAPRRADTPGLVSARVELAAADALSSVLSGNRTNGEGIARAEEILESTPLDNATIEPVITALLALLYGERLDMASAWCDELLGKAMACNAPSWRAQLSVVRAEIAMRGGDLNEAYRVAGSALRQLPPASWGIAIGLPLAALIRAASALGLFKEAESVLSIPTPEAMLKSRYGLGYLYARGQHHVSVNRSRAALNDFLACGELMVAWDLDLPAYLPWRAEAAAACLRIGDPDRARRLVQSQLERPGADRGWVKGVALRLLAETTGLKNAPELLRESVDILQTCGNRLELARSLVALGQAEQALGQTGRARMTLRFAAQVAGDCQAQPLLATLAEKTGTSISPPEELSPDVDEVTELSNAEQRVVLLAARGYTNREIAKRLTITSSTVEQHLTRVYRKLDVTGRDELPVRIRQALRLAYIA